MKKRVNSPFPGKAMCGLLSGLALMAGAVGAVEKNIYYQIGEQSLDKALKQYAAQTDVQVVYSTKSVASHAAQAVNGTYTPDQALSLLLNDSGLQYRFSSDDLVVVELKAGSESFGESEDSKRQMDGKDKERVLEEMIVTAQKREQSLKDVPISIVAMGGVELDDRNIGDLVELGMSVPGLFVEDNGASRSIYLRGVGNVAGVPMVGLYLDEMPITSYLSQGQLDTRIYDLERVEVLRGPQGTLYGAGSMGGTIRLITKNPVLDQFGGKAEVSASYTQGGSPSQKTQGVLNIPLIENELGIRIVGMFENSGGWIDQPAVNQKDINDQNVANLRLKTLWQPSETFSLNSTIVIHRNNAGAQSQSEDDNGNFIQPFEFSTTPSWEDDYNLYNLTLTKDFDGVSIVSSTSYTDAEVLKIQEGRLFQLLPPPAEPYDVLNLFSKSSQTALNQELRFSSNSDSAWQWSVGTFYRDFETIASGSTLFSLHFPGDPLPAPSSFVSERNSESWAVFGNTSYNFTEDFEVGVGVRYFKDDRVYFDGAVTQEASFDSVNPRFYVNYSVSDDVQLYSSVAKGFRSGGFNAEDQPSYDSDELWTYEVGTKMSAWDGRLDMEVALFYSEYEELQLLGVPPPPALPVSIITNGGKSVIKGMDLTLNWSATDTLIFQLNASVADTEVTELSVADSTYIVGDRIDFVPDYSFTASAIYDFIVADKSGFFRLDYNQRGSTLWTYRALGPHFIGKTPVNNMLNFNISMNLTDRVRFGVFGKNMLNDREYIAPTYLTGFAARNRPRTVGVEVSFDFE